MNNHIVNDKNYYEHINVTAFIFTVDTSYYLLNYLLITIMYLYIYNLFIQIILLKKIRLCLCKTIYYNILLGYIYKYNVFSSNYLDGTQLCLEILLQILLYYGVYIFIVFENTSVNGGGILRGGLLVLGSRER